jgi:hypothetical protein
LRGLDLLRFFPRPPAPFFRRPRSDLFTVAQALAEKTAFDAVLVAIIGSRYAARSENRGAIKNTSGAPRPQRWHQLIKTEQHQSKAARYLELLQSFDQFY